MRSGQRDCTNDLAAPIFFTQLNMTNNENDGDTNQRLSVSAARKMLGMVSKNYSDKDVEDVLDCLYAIAEESFDEYHDAEKQRKKCKN